MEDEGWTFKWPPGNPHFVKPDGSVLRLGVMNKTPFLCPNMDRNKIAESFTKSPELH